MSTDLGVPRQAGAPSLGRSLVIQARVIRALLLRELITRFGRRNLGLLWLVVEPMLFTLGVAALWTAVGASQRSNLPIVAFSITACCYFVLALRDVRAVEMRNSAGPARSALMDFIDAHGVKLMTGEIALLAVLTVTAIATDRK